MIKGIKPLVFEEHHQNGITAKGIFGYYHIYRWAEGLGGKMYWAVDLTNNEVARGDTEAKAIKAANRHNQEQIMPWLEVEE